MTFHRQFPKLTLLLATMISAYVLYALGYLHWIQNLAVGSEYIAMFIAGIFFSFGFTAAFGVAIIAELAPGIQHPIIAGMIGGSGALVADLIIFKVMQFEIFYDEIRRIKTTRLLLWIHGILHHERFPEKLRTYLFWSFAGLILASPFPDEIGVILVSSLVRINEKVFAVLCFTLNTFGILTILLLSQ